MASFSSLHLGRTAEQKEIKELGIVKAHTCSMPPSTVHTDAHNIDYFNETVDCWSSIQAVYSASSTWYVIVHIILKLLEKLVQILTIRVAKCCTMCWHDCTTPTLSCLASIPSSRAQ